MRKVSYFSAGLIASFGITDNAFEKFLTDLAEAEAEGEIARYGEGDLMRARMLLDNFMARARDDEDIDQGPGETLAACFIWNFFNTNPDASRVLEGDIVVVDLVGDLTTVEYAAASDLQMSQDDHDHDHHVHDENCKH